MLTEDSQPTNASSLRSPKNAFLKFTLEALNPKHVASPLRLVLVVHHPQEMRANLVVAWEQVNVYIPFVVATDLPQTFLHHTKRWQIRFVKNCFTVPVRL